MSIRNIHCWETTGRIFEYRVKTGRIFEYGVKTGRIFELFVKTGRIFELFVKTGRIFELFVKTGRIFEYEERKATSDKGACGQIIDVSVKGTLHENGAPPQTSSSTMSFAGATLRIISSEVKTP